MIQYQYSKNKIRFLISLAVFFLLGCSLGKGPLSSKSDEASKAWVFQNFAIDIKGAYIIDNTLYLKYQVPFDETSYSRTFFVKAALPAEKTPQQEEQYVQSFLTFVDEKAWKDLPLLSRQIDYLPQQNWKEFRSQLAHVLAPVESQTGVLLKKGKENLVVYTDENDQVIIKKEEDKPDYIRITGSVGQEQLAGKIIDVLKDYLSFHKKQERQIVFATDPAENNQLFLFVDLDRNLIASLSLPQQKALPEDSLQKSLKTLDYLVWDSHVWGLLRRPVSSGLRLFSWSKDTMYDFIHPRSITLLEKEPLPPLSESEGMDLIEWEKDLDQLLGRRAQWGTIKFLIDGDNYFPRLIKTFQEAKKSIEVRTFIFDNDDYAVEIADLLKAESNEGKVKVKVMVDAMGQIMGEGKIPHDLPPGFKPPTSIVDYLKKDSNVQVRLRSNAWFKADHTKTITIDGKITFTGGMNIGREYRYNWHDLMMEVEGPVVDEIRREFRLAWEHAGAWGDAAYLRALTTTRKNKEIENGHSLRTLYTRLNNPEIYRAQVAAIRKAKKYIYIHNAYFSDNSILFELIRARRRGVDVRVILPVNGNHEIMNSNNIVTANVMFRNGIRVYFYPGMSHVKAAVFDGWLCSGSANFDRLSLKDNLEFNLATSEKNVVDTLLKDLFEKDFSEAVEMKQAITASLKDFLGSIVAKQL